MKWTELNWGVQTEIANVGKAYIVLVDYSSYTTYIRFLNVILQILTAVSETTIGNNSEAEDGILLAIGPPFPRTRYEAIQKRYSEIATDEPFIIDRGIYLGVHSRGSGVRWPCLFQFLSSVRRSRVSRLLRAVKLNCGGLFCSLTNRVHREVEQCHGAAFT